MQRLVRPASEEATGTDAGDKKVAAVAAGEVVELPAEPNRMSRAGIEPATLCLKGRCSTD